MATKRRALRVQAIDGCGVVSVLHRWTQDGEEWACAAYDHGPMCRLCQRVDPDDGLTHALLDGVANGDYDVKADSDGTFLFRVTEQGAATARALIVEMGYDPDDKTDVELAIREIVRRPETN